MTPTIVFAGTPSFSAEILTAMLEAGFDVCACLTQPDRPQGRGRKLTPTPVKQVAMQHDIPVLQPAKLTPAHIESLRSQYPATLMLVVAYGLILPQAVLDYPTLGCVNIHASLLPRWRGAAPIQHAILAGDPQTGIALMQMEAGLDTGPVLASYPLDIQTDDTSATLSDKLCKLAQHGMIESLPKILQQQLQAISQPQNGITYASKIQKQDAVLDWALDAETLGRQVRAFVPQPVAFSHWQGRNIRIWQAEPHPNYPTTAAPGTIVALEKSGIDVACGTGALRLLTLQLPGKKPVEVAQLLNSQHGFQLGHSFGSPAAQLS